MAEKMKLGKKMVKPVDNRSKPNPSLRPGTGTMDMAQKMVKAPKKPKKGGY